MNDTYDIPPMTITKVQVITKFDVRVLEIVLFKSCILGVSFYNDERKFVEYRTFRLEGQDYDNWTNDAYLIDYIIKNMKV
jgi:hypothetical protein